MTDLAPDPEDTTSAKADWPAALIELLERQQEMVDKLGALAEQQAALVRERRTDALLGLLAERQRIIEAFTRAQDDLSAMTDDIEARLETVDEPRRTRIQSLIGEIGDRLAQVMQRDETDQAALAAVRGDVRGELGELDANRQARMAYRNTGTVTTRFADQRG